ncbi:MAG: exopolysaccharide biosynthesis protein, partial [Xanthobacteraceae bacterium]
MLQRLLDEMPAGHFTLGWLMGSLRKRSFGIIMLLLAVVAMEPGVSIIAGLLLMIPAFQMMAAQPAPTFPRCIADRPLPTRDLAALVQRAVPVLRYLEKVIHPRWPT